VAVFSAVVAGLVVLGCGTALVWARWQREREARAALARAQDQLLLGRPARALEAVAGVPERGPWEADLLTLKGMAFAALDRPDAVRPLLERSLKRDPNQPTAAKVLAAVYFSAGETERGFAMLDRASRLDPTDARPWYAAGEILLRVQNRPRDAVLAFQRALRRRPGDVDARVGLADALLSLGTAAEASPLLDAALRDRPTDPRVLRLAARRARLAGEADEMNRYAEQALAFDPDDTEALVLRADYLQRKGRPREALEFAERAVAGAPDDPSALSLLARVEGALGLKDRAAATSVRHRAARDRADRIGALREEIRQRPDDPEPRWRMGQVAAAGGMRALAVNSFREALARDPRCRPARDGLAALDVPADGPPAPPAGPAP
jgi:tetratricopeptide (TPR) repeat protein